MEKRALIAVVLSFLVLYVWGALFPAPKPVSRAVESTQDVQNKEDANTPTLSAVTTNQKNLLAAPSVPVPEDTHLVDTDELSARFSNIGGSLKAITIREYNTSLPVTGVLDLPGYEDKAFRLIESQNNRVSYQYEDQAIRIVKRYTFFDGDRLFKAAVEVTNLSEMSKQLALDVKAFGVDMSSLDKNEHNERDNILMEYSLALPDKIYRKGNAAKFSAKEDKRVATPVKWAGFRNRYFCMIIKPEYVVDGYDIEVVDEKQLNVILTGAKESIAPSESISYEFKIFSGPQKIPLLKSYDMGFEAMVDFGTGNFLDIMAFGLTNPIAKILLNILNLLHKIIPNWGFCIILLATIVYGATYPLTHKSLSSMRKMQLVQPEMIKIREKHKDNPQKLNKEIMELYKKHRVSPLGGCLPMMIQYPVFIGLYQLLWRDVAFKGAHFLWVKDLSEPDRLVVLKNSYPVIGNELNLLPVIFVILMMIQQKVSTRNVKGADPAQEATQKMMMKILPVFIFMVFYKIASGIALYFSCVSIFSIISQSMLAKQTKVAENV